MQMERENILDAIEYYSSVAFWNAGFFCVLRITPNLFIFMQSSCWSFLLGLVLEEGMVIT